ncbi:unnamed protein product, partial [Prorocentrum cordatum]
PPGGRPLSMQRHSSSCLAARRRIRAGESVSRSYLDAGALMCPTASRMQALRADWGFECGCARCSERVESWEEAAREAAVPLLPGGLLDLQRCAEPQGLSLDEGSVAAVGKVGTLLLLSQLLAQAGGGAAGLGAGGEAFRLHLAGGEAFRLHLRLSPPPDLEEEDRNQAAEEAFPSAKRRRRLRAKTGVK